MDGKKFDAAILANPISLESISQKKVFLNAVVINQSGIETKIPPISLTSFDFSKVPEQDPKFVSNKHSHHNELNCWEFIEVGGRGEYFKIYNPVIGLGLTVKPVKNYVKLTSNIH